MNSALLIKGLWKFHTCPALPWVRLLKQKHYTRRPATSPSFIPLGCCPIWKNMLKLYAPFLSSVDFILGDGKDTPFWTARWCGDMHLRNRFPILYAASANYSITVNTWSLCFSNQPNLGFDSLSSPHELSELYDLTVISNTLVLSFNRHDDLSWRWTSSGKFSVRTAAEFLMFDGINNCNLPFLWNLKIPLRVKIFLWLADRNKLLTADNLRKRGWHGPTICNLCYSDAESVEHILHHYFYAVSVWNWLTDRLNLNLAGRNNTTDGLAT